MMGPVSARRKECCVSAKALGLLRWGRAPRNRFTQCTRFRKNEKGERKIPFAFPRKPRVGRFIAPRVIVGLGLIAHCLETGRILHGKLKGRARLSHVERPVREWNLDTFRVESLLEPAPVFSSDIELLQGQGS